jgi:NTE family protein
MTDFNISIEEKEALYKVGYQTALEFIPKRVKNTFIQPKGK